MSKCVEAEATQARIVRMFFFSAQLRVIVNTNTKYLLSLCRGPKKKIDQLVGQYTLVWWWRN